MSSFQSASPSMRQIINGISKKNCAASLLDKPASFPCPRITNLGGGTSKPPTPSFTPESPHVNYGDSRYPTLPKEVTQISRPLLFDFGFPKRSAAFTCAAGHPGGSWANEFSNRFADSLNFGNDAELQEAWQQVCLAHEGGVKHRACNQTKGARVSSTTHALTNRMELEVTSKAECNSRNLYTSLL